MDGWEPAAWADELERRAGVCHGTDAAVRFRSEAAAIRGGG